MQDLNSNLQLQVIKSEMQDISTQLQKNIVRIESLAILTYRYRNSYFFLAILTSFFTILTFFKKL